MGSSFVTHLEGAIDGTRLEAGKPQGMHKDRPIWVRYDLQAIKKAVDRKTMEQRPPSMWRWREFLPVRDEKNIVTLGESMSPLLKCDRLGGKVGLSNLWIKDESQLPSGSFKARGQAMALTMCKEFGIKRVAIPTAGNAGGACALYSARAGIEAYVFMPADTSWIHQFEASLGGAKVFLVDGLINDCGKIIRQGMEKMGWFDVATLKEPYRLEGKKTMGLELAQQCNWKLPDVILYPTGGGTGLIGMWKAFQELREMGWLDSDKMPRMVSVQSTGCAPIVRAFEKGEKHAALFENAESVARGIRVPMAVGDFMILDAIRTSGGKAIAVDENRIVEWMKLGVSSEGISVGPESAACVGAAQELARSGWIKPGEQVVLYNCGAAQKYPDIYKPKLPLIKKDAVDWSLIEKH